MSQKTRLRIFVTSVALLILAGVGSVVFFLITHAPAASDSPFARVHGDTFKVVSAPEPIPGANLGIVTIERASDKRHIYCVVSLPFDLPVGTKVVPKGFDYRRTDYEVTSDFIYLDTKAAQ